MKHICLILSCFLLLSCSGKHDYEYLLDRAKYQYAEARYGEALQTLIIAEKQMDDEVTPADRGLTYIMKGAVHQAQFEYEEAILEYEKALEAIDSQESPEIYLRAVTYLCDIHIDNDDVANAGKYLEILERHKDTLSEHDRDLYHLNKIKYANLVHGPQAAVHQIEEYLATDPAAKTVPWRIFAYYFNEVGMNEKALEMIGKEVIYNDVSADPHYHYVLSMIQAEGGDYERAYRTLRRSSEIDDSLEVIRMKSDTRFLEERHEHTDRAVRDRNNLAASIIIFIIMAAGLGSALWATRKRYLFVRSENITIEEEKEKIEKMYAETLVERETLSKMSERSADEEMKTVIKQRLALLNKVITSYITDSSSANQEANAQLETLVSDRESFLESTRRSFEAGHPRFMEYLRSRGLTDWEMNYCCLYLVGLNGKDIGEYINLKRHYTYGSVIRHKLGLGEHDRNLANHLKQLLDNPPASNSSHSA